MKWISVKNKKPKDRQAILCYQENKYVPMLVLWYYKEKFVGMDDKGELVDPYEGHYAGILFWSELPEPPNDNDDEMTEAELERTKRIIDNANKKGW